MTRKYLGDFWSKYNPLARIRRSRMRSSLKNNNISFLCPNCIGGILFHDLGLEFRSPTINLMIYMNQFARFMLNFEHYANSSFKEYKANGFACPCALLDDIEVHFTHYKSFEEGVQKWNQRMQRVDKGNEFVFLMECDGLSYDDMVKLGEQNYKGLVIFTYKEYPDLPYCCYIPEYKDNGRVGNILKKSWVDDHRKYEEYFDFVKWFNEADGKNYDITPFKRR